MFLFIIWMRSFNYDARDKAEKWSKKAEVREDLLFLNVDCPFNPADSSSSSIMCWMRAACGKFSKKVLAKDAV